MTDVKQKNYKMGLADHQEDQSADATRDPTHTRRSATNSEFDLDKLVKALRRRKWLIISTTFVVCLLALISVLQITPLYTAQASVEISPRQSQVVDFAAVLSGLPNDTATIETEMQIIRSRKLAERAIEQLKLHRDPEFNGALRPQGTLESFFNEFYDLVKEFLQMPAALFDRTTPDLRGDDEMVSQGGTLPFSSEVGTLQEARDSLIDTFLSKLSVAAAGRSRVLNIIFESEDPRKSAAAANAIADLYIVAQLEAKFEATKRANDWLNQRVVELREEVEVAERAIETFRYESGLVQGEREVTLASEQISDLSTQLVLERARLAEAEARLRQTQNLLSSSGGIETASEVLASPLIRELRTEESALERQLAELSSEYGERHPRMINARAELQDLRSKIKVEVDKVVQGLRNEVSVARARTASLAAALEDLKTEKAGQEAEEVTLRMLEREAAASRSLLEQLLARAKETSSQEDFLQADANILSYASIPDAPSYPKRKLMILVALVGGVSLGVFLAFIVEMLDRGFRSRDQIERITGLSCLGLIPALKGLSSVGKKTETYVLERPTSAFGEAIRNLHTSLLLSVSGQRSLVVLVASSLPKEGKTTLVISLARMLATIGQRVLIIDCDLRRPKMHKIIDVDRAPGLTDCLLGNASIKEIVREDSKSGAHLVSAGTSVSHPPSLLGGKRMEALLNTFAQQYDVVLLDSAPVGAVADAKILTRMVDETVFLVQWKQTRREVALNALKQLKESGGRVLGILLTMVDVKEHAQYDFGDSGAYYGTVKKYYTG